jgi:hypothetical protein
MVRRYIALRNRNIRDRRLGRSSTGQTLPDAALYAIRVPRPGSGRSRKRPAHLIADRATATRPDGGCCAGGGSHTPSRSGPTSRRLGLARGTGVAGRPWWTRRATSSATWWNSLSSGDKTESECFPGGWDHVADLHLAVSDDHPVDQQLHQLAALRERGLVQAGAEPLQHGGGRLAITLTSLRRAL